MISCFWKIAPEAPTFDNLTLSVACRLLISINPLFFYLEYRIEGILPLSVLPEKNNEANAENGCGYATIIKRAEKQTENFLCCYSWSVLKALPERPRILKQISKQLSGPRTNSVQLFSVDILESDSEVACFGSVMYCEFFHADDGLMSIWIYWPNSLLLCRSMLDGGIRQHYLYSLTLNANSCTRGIWKLCLWC